MRSYMPVKKKKNLVVSHPGVHSESFFHVEVPVFRFRFVRFRLLSTADRLLSWAGSPPQMGLLNHSPSITGYPSWKYSPQGQISLGNLHNRIFHRWYFLDRGIFMGKIPVTLGATLSSHYDWPGSTPTSLSSGHIWKKEGKFHQCPQMFNMIQGFSWAHMGFLIL